MRYPLLFSILFLVVLQSLEAQQIVYQRDTTHDCGLLDGKQGMYTGLYENCPFDSLYHKISPDSALQFPLRIGIVQLDSTERKVKQADISLTIHHLNNAFFYAGIQFYISRIDWLESPYVISDLSSNAYQPYIKFSEQYDLEDTISLFVFDYDPDLCKVDETSVSCGRTGGFSFILSEQTNNVVLSRFDIGDHKIINHEFGHFFGLFHTFEKAFGEELISGENCATAGDQICDTPADPGAVYEVYVNYSKCEMQSNYNHDQKATYQPLINNYMSYYKPCYLKAYEFTPMQYELLYTAARMDIRRSLAD